MKTFEITLKIRNNQLKERREELGLTGAELSRRIGCGATEYSLLERMLQSPLRTRTYPGQSQWRAVPVRLARFYGVDVQTLFPNEILRVTKTTSVVKVDAIDLRLTANTDRFPQLTDNIEDAAIASEKLMVLDELVRAHLSPREEGILRMHCEDNSLEQIGEFFGISRERARQILEQAKARVRFKIKTGGTEMRDVFTEHTSQ